MNTTNLSFAEAEIAMDNGQFIAVPEWGGFWFKMPEGVKTLTIPSTIQKAWTAKEDLTTREDWKLVDGLLSIGEAILVLKHGYAMRRKDWKPYEYIFLRPSDLLDRSIIGVVKSLPAMIKALLHREYTAVKFKEYLCKADGNIIHNGWLPNTEELLATDWVIATDVR